MADTAPGNMMRERLAASGLLWPLMALRQPPTRPGTDFRAAPGRLVSSARRRRTVLRDRLVTPTTDVCIEGFPRSANTYTVVAFRRWNPGVRIAHHVHAAFQVRLAARLAIPCCVIVRRPLDAVASVVVMMRGRVSDDACYQAYIRFHARITPLLGHVVTCRFEEVLEDPAIAVERLNRRFGTRFDSHPITPEAKDLILKRIRGRAQWLNWMLPDGSAPAPSAQKDELKAMLHGRLRRNPLLPDAEATYRSVLGDEPAA